MRNRTHRASQSGAALLVMMLVVLVAATATLLARLDTGAVKIRRSNETRAALAHAKDALLTYAAIQPDLAGTASVSLPCPDLDAGGTSIDGESHTSACGMPGVTMFGRYPWRTVGVPAYKDNSGACLWYVVSGTYKNAAGATMPMVNPDNNGQLQIYSLETGAIVQGQEADERPVAMILAPMPVQVGQSRVGTTQPWQQCSDDFTLAAYFEADGMSGIANNLVSGVANALEQFIVASAQSDFVNDQVHFISRSEFADAVYGRHDFAANMDTLGRAIAACIAHYGSNNPGGVDDRRLPWPAPVSLSDYHADASYDDFNGSSFSGRLADRVDDSNLLTGNSIGQLMSACDSVAVPEWQAQSLALWRNWKDHFFYVVAESFQPGAPVPSSCGQCLSVNGAGQYAAVVLFAHRRLPALGQLRNAPPQDADTRWDIANYLESVNATNHPYSGGSADFVTAPPTAIFNDTAFCIDTAMNVVPC